MKKRRNRRLRKAAAYFLTVVLVLSIGSGATVLAGAEETDAGQTETGNPIQTEQQTETAGEPKRQTEQQMETPGEPEPQTETEPETDGPESELTTEPMETETPEPTPTPQTELQTETEAETGGPESELTTETETGNVPEETPEPIQTLQAVQASSPAPRANDVAKVEMNGSTSYYQSLDAAITAVGSGTATITLLANASITKFGSGGINGNVILEGGNYTITGDGMGFTVFGTLTIKSGHIDSSCVLTSAGTINIYGGNIDCVTLYPMPGFSVNVYGGTISLVQGGGSLSFKPVNFNLNKQNLTLAVGKSETLTASVDPAISAPGFGVSWTSSDTRVATVNNGTVTAVAPGTATITAQAGDKTATCTVTVGEAIASVEDSSGKVTKYIDLDAAAKAASESPGSTLTLLDNVTGRTSSLTLSGNMTFNLNNFELRSSVPIEDGIIRIKSGSHVTITNGTVWDGGQEGEAYIVVVESDAELSGNAMYTTEGKNPWVYALANSGIVNGGSFLGRISIHPNASISGGEFTGLSLDVYGGSLKGGKFSNNFKITFYDGTSLQTLLEKGYVGYADNGAVVLGRNTQLEDGEVADSFEIRQHDSHTYNYTETSQSEPSESYTYTEGECTSCGVVSTNSYTVTIPMNAEIGKETTVSVNNQLSQAKTVSVSTDNTVTLTREDDSANTQIISTVDFETLSVGQNDQANSAVTFGQPVYNNDENAVIPAGTYKGTLTFTISVQ